MYTHPLFNTPDYRVLKLEMVAQEQLESSEPRKHVNTLPCVNHLVTLECLGLVILLPATGAKLLKMFELLV